MRTLRSRIVISVFISVFSGVTSPVWPQTAASPSTTPDSGTGATASVVCFSEPAKLSDQDVQAFLANPQTLLQSFSGGGLAMSSRVRALAGSSGTTLSPIILLASVPQANADRTAPSNDQVSALGSGLGRAARSCVSVNPEYAVRIQQEVIASENEALIVAFRAANAELPTAALGATASTAAGAAAAAAIGGAGAGTGTGTSGSATDGQSFTTTVSGSYNISSQNRYFASATSTSAGNSGSVSPTTP
jgi:hypothetical protein